MMKKTAKLFTVVLIVCAMLTSIIATTLVSAEEENLPEAIDGEVTSAETIGTEEPTAEEPEAEEPAAEEPAAEEPAAEEPAAEEPTAEEPVAEEPVVEEPVVEEPVAEEPVVEEPVAEEPVAEEPVAEEPVAEEPVAEEPVAEEPVAEEPVAEEPVAEEPVVEEPVAEEPIAEEPVAEEPIAEEPVAEEPVAEEPVAEEPVVEEPVAEETLVFSCELSAKLENVGDIIEGQQITLNATVLNANMDYSFQWQRTPKERNEDEEEIWSDIENTLTYTFEATEDADDYFYRAALTAEDGTTLYSDRISFDVLPAEETIEEEQIAEEPVVEEIVVEEPADEEPAAEEPEAEEETGAGEELAADEELVAEEEVIEDYETPLGIYEYKTIVLGEEETGINVREGADSLAAIYMTLPAGTEVTVLRQDGDWVMVFANEAFGFIYIDDLAGYLDLEEEEEKEEEPVEGIAVIEKKVTIFTSRRTLMEEGEEIQLTSKLEGFEDCEEIRYVWKVDKGNGFEVVEGENGDTLTYTASLESLNWDWHLTVMYR